MSSPLDEARSVLELAGFATFSPQPNSTFFHFEDISLMGHVRALATAEEIVAKWERIQDDFLSANAPRLVRDPTKAWNLYTVLLTAEPAAGAVPGRLFAIEEDFRGTRKIVRAGVVARQDILTALGPLLPLQNVFFVGGTNPKQRLSDRLGTLHGVLRSIATDATPESIATALLGPT